MTRSISSETLKEIFGAKSRIYSSTFNKFNTFWMAVKEEKDVKQKYVSLKKCLEMVYGKMREDLFLTYTYLALIVKLVMYLRFEKIEKSTINKERLEKVISGEYFSSIGIANFTENDFSAWILNSKIVNDSLELVYELSKRLSEYDFSQIDEDIFKEIYEELVEKNERHKAGEYYTPEWLSQLILLEVFDIWENEQKKIPKILDPACGSGTFLCNAIHLIRNRYSEVSLRDILDSVIGIDINPLACLIAKANYLIAIGYTPEKHIGKITIPIYLGDALKLPKNIVQKADIIIGNPPWIVMRNIKNKEYQEFLKNEVLNYKLLEKEDVHLFTQIEMASLFFCKCSDIYLKTGGIMGFVMPRSVISGTIQHINFRRFQKPSLKLVKVLDLEHIQPLFNMPACVLIAIKGKVTEYPVVAIKYSGKLPKKNAKLNEVKNLLSRERYTYAPPEFPTIRSYYFDKFKVGASIFPRTFYFVDIISSSNSYLLVRTSKEILEMVKPPWKIELKGTIEAGFIYLTLLAWEIIPFGYLKLRPVVLPIKHSDGGYIVFDPPKLQELGFVGVSEWFKEAQRIWEEKRTAKSTKRFPRLVDRLNYNGLLTYQHPNKRYVVVYNATGTDVVSCVIDRKSLQKYNGFVVDVKSWFYETNNDSEAHYLSAVLNSELISKLIKPFQPRGLFGARAVHRRPLLLPIPKFEDNEVHVELSEMSKVCHEKVKVLLNRKIGRIRRNGIRNQIRKYLHNEIKDIDNLVSELLNISKEIYYKVK